MTPASPRDEETRFSLDMAATDLRMADLAFADNPPLVGEALFHAQQAAEKALKAFLVWSGKPYPPTHNIGELLDLCTSLDPTLEAAASKAAGLTQFATDRYLHSVASQYARAHNPGGPPPPLEEARHWLDAARKTHDEIRRRTIG